MFKHKVPKYLKQILIYSFIISTLPVSFLGIFSYFTASTSILDKVTKSTNQIVSQTELALEENLKIMDRSTTQFVQLPIVIEAMNKPLDSTQFQLIREINLYIEYTLMDGLGIKDVYFINMQYNWAIYKDRIFLLSQEQQEQFDRIDKRSRSMPLLVGLDRHSGIGLSSIGLPDGMYLIKQLPYSFKQTHGLLISRLDTQMLDSWLSASNSLGDIFLLNANHQIIASNTTDPALRNLEATIWNRLAKQPMNEQGYSKTVINGQRFYLFRHTSDYSNWTYMSVVPDKLISRDSRKIGYVTLFTCIAMFIVIIILVSGGTLKIYSPVKKLLAAIPNQKTGQAGLDEFNYLNSSISEMNQQLSLKDKELQKFYVLKLFHGELLHNEVESKIIGQHPKFGSFDCFVVANIQIDTLEGSRFRPDDQDLLLFAIMNITQETLPEACRLSPVIIRTLLVCLIGINKGDSEVWKKELLEHAKQIQSNISTYLNLSVSIGFSRLFSDIHDAPAYYEEGENALKYRVKYGNGSILFIQDVEPASNPSVFRYPEHLSIQLGDAIKLNEEEQVVELLHNFIDTVFKHNGSFADYQVVLIRLLGDIMRLHHPENDNASMLLDGQSLPKQLLELKSPDEIKAWFLQQVIIPVRKLIQEKSERADRQISDEMVRIVQLQEEYDHTLESIGTKLNYSPTYLSKVFRREKGISFTEFLTAHRIVVAKKWLVSTDLSVNEIAMKLGYTNAQNFIRTFKREVGSTPGKYRLAKNKP